MGARSNAILVSEEDNIIQACAYQVSSSTTVRPLQTGGVYQRPPSGGGIFSPLNKEKVDIEERLPLFSTRMKELDVTVEKSLVSCYRGMSPNIAHRILDAAEVECSVMVRSLTDIQISNIFKYFSSWAMIFENSEGSVGSTLSQPGSSSHSGSSSGSGSGSILKVEPLMIQYPGKKAAEFCPISFVKENSIVNEIDGGSGIRVSNLLAVDELVVGTTVDSSSGSDSGSDSKTAGDNLILSKFLLSYYSLYERKTAFELLHSACEKKVALRMKKADKILKDFQTQEKDAK